MKGVLTSGNVPPEEENDHVTHAADTQATNTQTVDTQAVDSQVLGTQAMGTQDEEGNPQNIPDFTPDNNAFLESKTEIHHDPTPLKEKN